MSRLASASPNFQIILQPSGRQFETLANETILNAGIRQGVNLPYGCKDGACGSCKCRKLSGTVSHAAHQSKALSDDEASQGYVLTCQCYPLTDRIVVSYDE